MRIFDQLETWKLLSEGRPQKMLCEKFAQQIGVSLRVEECKDTAEMVSKLEKFGGETGKVEVSLKVVKPETAMNKEVAIRLQVAGATLFAQEVCDTFEEATLKTVDTLTRQLSKNKDKQKNR